MLRQAQHERDEVVRQLVCHPDTPAPAIRIDASIVLADAGGLVSFRYAVRGAIECIAWPEASRKPPVRQDGLWQTTCFEAFGRRPGHGYREFNFSPSGNWASYDFSSYREGMRVARVARGLIVARFPTSDGCVIEGMCATSDLAGARSFALSAVIEETDGTKSYWALRHPPGPPDFHHPDCFALELPALA